MNLTYKKFEIEVFIDPNYTLNSGDNLKQYKHVYFDESNDNRFRPTNKHAIIIKEFGNEISNAIICEVGGATGIYYDSFIIEDDKLWIIVYNKIYCLEVPSLELVWHNEFDFHVNFSIYKLKEDLIIHGESQIFRITKQGEIVWSFGGRDIWFNVEGEPELTIENNAIRLFDFQSNEYVLDFDGNQIEDNPRIVPEEIKKKWWNIFG